MHTAYPVWRKHTLVAMARAKQLQEQGHDVTLTYCDAEAGTCTANFAGNPVVCGICRSRTRRTAESLGLHAVPLRISEHPYQPLPVTASRADTTNQTTASLNDAIAVTGAERVHLLEGVRSALVSTFRTMPADISRSWTISLIQRRFYRTAIRMLSSMKSLIADLQPDRIEVFNGRQACSRFCITAARSMGVDFSTLEVCARQHPMVFAGHTAHDRHEMQKRMLRNPADMELAEQYFARRRSPRSNKFAKKHATDFVPPAATGFKKRVTVFLSSQDEFESLGRDWRSPFPDYAAVVQELCKEHPQTMFCIRFHPNQADISSDIRTPFHAVEELPNVQVYYPETSANTYALIEWSDVVVTFGSTVTVEACWMGRPVILMGPSFYDALGVACTPGNMQQTHELLRDQLQPGSRENCARWATFVETDWNDLPRLHHNGRTFIAEGFDVAWPTAARLARLADNVFYRIVKWSTGKAAALRRSRKKQGQTQVSESAVRNAGSCGTSQLSPAEESETKAA